MQHYLSEDLSLPEDPGPLASAWGGGLRLGRGHPQGLWAGTDPPALSLSLTREGLYLGEMASRDLPSPGV